MVGTTSSSGRNRLAERLQLVEQDPIDVFDENPTVANLCRVEKFSQTTEMVAKALDADDAVAYPVLKYASKRAMTHDLCLKACQVNPDNVKYVKPSLLDEEICLVAVSTKGSVLWMIPERYRTFEVCLTALRHDWKATGERGSALNSVPRNLLNGPRGGELRQAAKEPNPEQIEVAKERKRRCADYLHDRLFDKPKTFALPEGRRISDDDRLPEPSSLALPSPDAETSLSARTTAVSHVVGDDAHGNSIFYVTDVHVEHQLGLGGVTLSEARTRIGQKVHELAATALELGINKGTVLVGGDVADSLQLTDAFYKALHRELPGWTIMAVLGNHELWDGDEKGTRAPRPLDDIIKSYEDVLVSNHVCPLEDSLYILYRGDTPRNVGARIILDADPDELSEILAESTLIVLGGIGFSGLNPLYNAANGFYRNAVTPGEDRARSERFRAVYEKVLCCAGDQRVIVLTHNPVRDWTHEQPHPGWVYINGHTHQNGLVMREDGTCVLYDNQLGYKPKPWRFNRVLLPSNEYDPLGKLGDGVHEISIGQYVDFNRTHGIPMDWFKRRGTIYALKRSGVHMFLFRSSKGKLHLLEGGRIRSADHDVAYYFDNMVRYATNVLNAFRPYETALAKLSDEVREFGGSGTIHGCIVDVDSFNHVYLNPYDGKITFYFAPGITQRTVYKTLRALLKESPCPPRLEDGSLMLQRFDSACRKGNLPLLTQQADAGAIAIVPEAVIDTGTEMYDPSRIMRSIQYVFDQGVIRIWRDDVADYDEAKGSSKQDNRLEKGNAHALGGNHPQ